MWKLCAYAFAAGPAGTPPAAWPGELLGGGSRASCAAVVALHPECECSTATLTTLDEVVRRSAGKLYVTILVVQLPGLPPVETSDLWRRAQRISGVNLVKDQAGRQARLIGARTSGDVSLYGPDGRLRFHGGITPARGEVGRNPGAAALTSELDPERQRSLPITTPVFGCALWDECAAPAS